MPKYKLKKDHYLHHRFPGDKFATPRLHSAGQVVEFDGPPSLAMDPVGKDAEERIADRNEERRQEHERLRANSRASVGWTPQLENSMKKVLGGSVDLPSEQPVDSIHARSKARRGRAA